MSVTEQEVRIALRSHGLAGRAVCVHSSLRSFGRVTGGAHAVVRAFLDEGCTVLVPAFSSAFEVAPPPHLRFERTDLRFQIPLCNLCALCACGG